LLEGVYLADIPHIDTVIDIKACSLL